MDDFDSDPGLNNVDLELLAQKQALQYGKDLARIFVAERAKREKLQVAYQALNAIFASTTDAIVVLNEAQTIQQANQAFSNLIGHELSHFLGQPLSEFLACQPLQDLMRQSWQPGVTSQQMELQVNKPVRRSVRANVARLQAGQLGGWAITLQDQSALKRLDYQKAEFINIAAHELRTPLSAILAYADVLKNSFDAAPEKLSDEQRNYLDAVIRGGQRLNSIVKELFQFAELNED